MGVDDVEQKANLHKNIERMWVIELIEFLLNLYVPEVVKQFVSSEGHGFIFRDCEKMYLQLNCQLHQQSTVVSICI